MTDSFFSNVDPGLDPNAYRLFSALCTTITPDETPELQAQVLAHVTHIRDQLRTNEFLDIDLAERLADKLVQLLQGLAAYSQEDQRLIVGAARYFVSDDDAEPDTQSILGLDDDLAVFNYVVTQLGQPDLRIEV